MLLFVQTCIQPPLSSLDTYTPNVQARMMDLAKGTYSSVHVFISACLLPSDVLLPVHLVAVSTSLGATQLDPTPSNYV